jgi:hypothetical protein
VIVPAQQLSSMRRVLWSAPVPAVRHAFDTMMFRSIWGPCVHALGVVLEHADGEAAARAALDGLQLAAR